MSEVNTKTCGRKCFIIAEAGVNHNGSMDLALKLIEAAKQAGADAVKFQTFVAEDEISKYAPKAEYQKEQESCDESQLEMVKKLELNRGQHEQLIQCCAELDIKFMSSAFDLKSIQLLGDIGVDIYKIPSGEITNLPYLRTIGRCRKQIILSTGMATLDEIQSALQVLEESGTPRDHITVLHCNTEYPTPMEDVNLNAMLTIREAFGVAVGYSDHTVGPEVAISAVALGACVIEKHLTIDRTFEGPDHAASAEPLEFAAMVKSIRNIEVALGDGVKKASKSEAKNIPIVRKSIVAARDIANGEILDESNLTTKRPGTGISAMKWDRVLGTLAGRAYKADEMIDP